MTTSLALHAHGIETTILEADPEDRIARGAG
ncbi:hypothetical protein [Natrinema soli]|uniref:Uncharacterized protein n=1 Tax=Natrinema soli TaxID=1930624 RepID=A0ABD5SLB2_9EURY|nr:hypothetical protein [Natrinema soli]